MTTVTGASDDYGGVRPNPSEPIEDALKHHPQIEALAQAVCDTPKSFSARPANEAQVVVRTVLHPYAGLFFSSAR